MAEHTFVRTGKPEFDNLVPRIKSFLDKDSLDCEIDGVKIRGYRSPDARSVWIRDFSDMLRGVKYFEKDVTSAVEHFAATQAANGRIFDYFTIFPEKLPCEKENWTKYVRVPVEADVEYRFVKAAYLAWQAAGENGWIQRLLPSMEKALHYVMSHPWRWDTGTGLVKRAYTIDTWDFAYTAGKHDWLQFRIDKDTYWGIMHGDNSGYYEAFRLMSWLYSHFGEKKKADFWAKRAAELRRNMNSVCWNGRFYTHFVKLVPVKIPGVDEEIQLSLSNPMDINRGVATHKMAISIIDEYVRRKEEGTAFAEWFSIDPPFPDGVFGEKKLVKGAYINGGIMPLVGGELAKAALEHGRESYGVDILRRYSALTAMSGETYLWYFPDGSPLSLEASTSPEASPTDGWGSSAMLFAFLEGLAGIQDHSKLFLDVTLSPRWAAAGVDEAEVRLAYREGESTFAYDYKRKGDGISLRVAGPGGRVRCHVLLPDGFQAANVAARRRELPFANELVEDSPYVNFSVAVRPETEIHIRLEKKKDF
ncbi:MAG: hypothetical protein JXB26_03965 [Candidatus Aminicenantes bacterium]|nr:hypothetical protein [Candidatus Aminicenantes bacterium]